MGFGSLCKRTSPYYVWMVLCLLLVQYLRVFSALPVEPTRERVRRTAAAAPGAYATTGARRGPKPGSNPGNLSGRNHGGVSGKGTIRSTVPPGASEGAAPVSHHHLQVRVGGSHQPSGAGGDGGEAVATPMDCDSGPSAERASSTYIPNGFAKMGPKYKVPSLCSDKVQNEKLDCLIDRMGDDGLPLLCKRWNSTSTAKDKADVAADICRMLGPLASKAKNPVCVIEPKSVNETAAALLDLDTSHTKFNRLRKMLPGLFKTPAQVSKFWKLKDLAVKPVLVGNKTVGYAIADVMGKVVKPQLRRFLKDWVKNNPGVDPKSVRHRIPYKYGGDSFSYDAFDNTKVSCEQFMFTLLPPDVKYPNSYLQSTPLGFMHNVPESHAVLKSMATVLEPQLPRGINVIEGVTYEFVDFVMADYAFACKYQGHQGQGAFCGCNKCLERCGDNVCLNPLVLDPVSPPRTFDNMNFSGNIAKKYTDFSVGMSDYSRNLRAQPFPCVSVSALATQEEFFSMALADADLQDLMRAKRVAFNFRNNSINSGLNFIKKTCDSMFYPSLSLTPPERYMPDVLHWFINVAGREIGNKKTFVHNLAKQLGGDTVQQLNFGSL
jgi:hypothetical protein